MERNICLRIAYDGTDFHGWQTQAGVRTVQGELQDTLLRVVRHPTALSASGRTDAGVHAKGQVANFPTTCPIPAERIAMALGSRVPEDIAIVDAIDVAPQFHATRSAASKLYRYRIHHHRVRPVSRMAQRHCYHCWHALDVDRMAEAARTFVGMHDYSAFASAGCVRESMMREVLRCNVHRRFQEIRIDVEGTGFLYNQVRIMVGTLIEIGRGRWPVDCIPQILASRDRRRAGPTARAAGLCLQWVRYPAEMMRAPAWVADWQNSTPQPPAPIPDEMA